MVAFVIFGLVSSAIGWEDRLWNNILSGILNLNSTNQSVLKIQFASEKFTISSITIFLSLHVD